LVRSDFGERRPNLGLRSLMGEESGAQRRCLETREAGARKARAERGTRFEPA